MTAFELAVQDLDGVAVAARLGLDRLELCSALAGGGVTASRGLVEAAVASGVPTHVLVRPREGDFEYSPAERALIVRDAAIAVTAGAAGVVVGGTCDGRVDETLMRAVRDAVGPASVTFHRALDTIDDRRGALDTLILLGVTRVLTSGGASAARSGIDEIVGLVAHADSAIEVMAGGGVDADDVAPLLAAGVDALHASCKRAVPGAGIALGSAGAAVRETTDEQVARRLRDLVRGAAS